MADSLTYSSVSISTPPLLSTVTCSAMQSLTRCLFLAFLLPQWLTRSPFLAFIFPQWLTRSLFLAFLLPPSLLAPFHYCSLSTSTSVLRLSELALWGSVPA
eukprot:g57677.t1